MREIKFRAWVEPNTEACHPYMNYHPEFHGYINDIFSMNGIKPLTRYDSKITYMQFTGLHDKNGKEIYEGDILAEHGDEEYFIYGIVTYCSDQDCVHAGQYYLADDLEGYVSDFWEGDWSEVKHLEIIGNICENSKLLEGASS